jgi:hypothetical protein
MYSGLYRPGASFRTSRMGDPLWLWGFGGIIVKSVERRSWCWGMLAEKEIFRDLWLDKRGSGLRVVVSRFKSAFHIFGNLRVKQVGLTGGRLPGVG